MFTALRKKWWELPLLAALLMGLAAMLGCLYADWAVQCSAAGKIYTDVSAAPAKKVGLVLGCAPWTLFFQYRIKAAADLFHAGKIRYILVSGDNGRKTYDEPTAMRQALIEAGVPADKIVCDYAGFRTLDSLVRVRAVFLEDDITIISQRFHLERALYLAARKKIKACGFCARAPHRAYNRWTAGPRETLARARAVLDVLWGTRPKFFGEALPIGNKKQTEEK